MDTVNRHPVVPDAPCIPGSWFQCSGLTTEMGDTGTTTRRKKGNKVSLSVNVTKKEKKTREVVGAELEETPVKQNVVTENVEEELTEKLATLLERDRSGVRTKSFCTESSSAQVQVQYCGQKCALRIRNPVVQ